MEIHQPLVRCNFQQCGAGAEIALGQEKLCREHFVSICVSRLDVAAGLFEEASWHSGNLKSVRFFTMIKECAEAATHLMCGTNDLSPLEQASLTQILLRAIDLSRRLGGKLHAKPSS